MNGFMDDDCPYCGVDLTEELEKEFHTMAGEDGFEFTCPRCGKLMDVTVRFEEPTFYTEKMEEKNET